MTTSSATSELKEFALMKAREAQAEYLKAVEDERTMIDFVVKHGGVIPNNYWQARLRAEQKLKIWLEVHYALD